MSAEQNNLAATVFVYRSRIDQRIRTEYLETALVIEDSPDWEHLATLEPRWWIQAHYDAVTQRDELLAELKKVREVIAAWNQAFVETVTNQSTGLIDDPEDILTAEADQDLLNGIDAAIAKTTGSQS
jgi:hypothetical protein